jgi:hypothetical protein
MVNITNKTNIEIFTPTNIDLISAADTPIMIAARYTANPVIKMLKRNESKNFGKDPIGYFFDTRYTNAYPGKKNEIKMPATSWLTSVGDAKNSSQDKNKSLVMLSGIDIPTISTDTMYAAIKTRLNR